MRVAIMVKMAIDITKGYFQSVDSRAGMGAQAGAGEGGPRELAPQGVR